MILILANFNLFEFLAAILEKGLLFIVTVSVFFLADVRLHFFGVEAITDFVLTLYLLKRIH